jgi:hypothetical protein
MITSSAAVRTHFHQSYVIGKSMYRAAATAQRVGHEVTRFFKKGWCRRFFGIHFWNIPKALEDRVEFQKQCHDQYATITGTSHPIEKRAFSQNT